MIAKPATPKAFKPYTPAHNARLADIDKGQPPMKTLKGVGAEYVRSWGGREGSR